MKNNHTNAQIDPGKTDFSENMPKKRKFWKVLLYIFTTIIAITLLFFFLPYVFGIITSDIKPIDDSDLQLSVVNVPDSENMYFDLLAFGEPPNGVIDEARVKINEPIGGKVIEGKYVKSHPNIIDHILGREWNEAFIKDVVANNQKAYEVFDRAVKKPYYQFPLFADPKNFQPDATLPPLHALRSIARLQAIRAFKVFTENEKQGIDETIKIIDFGQKLQDSHGVLIQFLVSMAVKNTGFSAFNVLVKKSHIPPDELLNYIDILEKYKSSEKGLVISAKSEYIMQSYITDMFASGKFKTDPYFKEGLDPISRNINSFYFRPNETKQLFADIARSLIAESKIPCASIPKNDKNFISDRQYIKLYFTENAAGKILANIIFNSLGDIFDKICNSEFNADVNQITAALKAYEIDNNTMPSSLDKLVPKYMHEIPSDPFDGKKIRYSRDKMIIYSVGIDGIDSGGSEGDYWKEMPDPTFKI